MVEKSRCILNYGDIHMGIEIKELLKDGYYLSAYIHIDSLAHLTGARIRHDQNISLWIKKGSHIQLVAYWELERLTGIKKHSISFFCVEDARSYISNLLSKYNLSLEDIEEIWGTPELSKNYTFLNKEKNLTYHSIAHLFSGLLINTNIFNNNDIIALAVDGGPDNVIEENARNKMFYSGCVSMKGKISELFYVSSPALLWSYARVKYGMEQGTLMALAEATNSRYFGDFERIRELNNKKTAKKAYEWFEFVHSTIFALNEKDQRIKFSGFDERFSEKLNKISMVIKIIQNESLCMMKDTIQSIMEKFELTPNNTYISVTGGYGLNCVSNSAIVNHFGFKGLLSPPCISDTGQSLGMALFEFYKNNRSVRFSLDSPYYGEEDDTLDNVISDNYWSKYIKSIQPIDVEVFIKDIENGPVVWFNGRAEIGPRALGARSILADPRKKNSKDILNKIKQREWWRPVAPIIIEQYLDEWFENAYVSPFMLNTFNIKKDKLVQIPAISHMDTSARIQSLNRITNPLLYDLMCGFFSKTGIPMLCNTSLNDKGEPIINRIPEALNFALRKRIKYLYVNGYRVELDMSIIYEEKNPLMRDCEYFRCDRFNNNGLKEKELNPYELKKEVIELYYLYPTLKNSLDITQKRDVEKLMKIIKRLSIDLLINE